MKKLMTLSLLLTTGMFVASHHTLQGMTGDDTPQDQQNQLTGNRRNRDDNGEGQQTRNVRQRTTAQPRATAEPFQSERVPELKYLCLEKIAKNDGDILGLLMINQLITYYPHTIELLNTLGADGLNSLVISYLNKDPHFIPGSFSLKSIITSNVIFTSDSSKFMFGSYDVNTGEPIVKIYETTGNLFKTLTGLHFNEVVTLTLTKDNELVTGSTDGTVVICNWKRNQVIHRIHPGYAGGVHHLIIDDQNPDKLITAGMMNSDTVKAWNIQDGTLLNDPNLPENFIDYLNQQRPLKALQERERKIKIIKNFDNNAATFTSFSLVNPETNQIIQKIDISDIYDSPLHGGNGPVLSPNNQFIIVELQDSRTQVNQNNLPSSKRIVILEQVSEKNKNILPKAFLSFPSGTTIPPVINPSSRIPLTPQVVPQAQREQEAQEMTVLRLRQALLAGLLNQLAMGQAENVEPDENQNDPIA